MLNIIRNAQIHVRLLTVQGPIVRKVDNAIRWINLYPVDNAIDFPNTYLLDSDLSVDDAIQRLNNRSREEE